MVDALKIASGDNDVPQLLDAAGASGRPVVYSTGMSDLVTVGAAHERLRAAGATEIGILHCVSAYPTPPESAALASIPHLSTHFPDAVVGYSDHTLGLDAAVAAVGLGARIVEKHITLRKDFSDFRDHQLSAEPHELAELVERARTAAPPAASDVLVGEPKHDVLPVERDTAKVARRSLAARRDLEAGHRLLSGDLISLRPRDGLVPADEPALLGRELVRPLARGETVSADDLAPV
jgi:sialic acid synthase SpsE